MLTPNDLLNNRYRILALLGEGGMGAVYRAHDEILDTPVAVKENQVVTAAAQRQFEREARLLAGLRHVYLPRVTDHFIIAGQGQYLVMDFVEGEDLSARLARTGRQTEADVLNWAQHVLEALAYLHGRGIIHRDIKPANIKISPDGRATLVDFGIAKVAGTGQTTTGARGLTPGYAPPEQYGFGSTDARSDVYAFAATLYNALTGLVPTDSFARLTQHTPLIPVQQLAPGVSTKTAEVIEMGLALKLEERWAAAEDMRKALLADTAPGSARRAQMPTLVQPDPHATLYEPAPPAGVPVVARPVVASTPPAPLPSSPAAVPQPGTAPQSVTTPQPATRRNWIGLGLLGVFGAAGLGLLAVIAVLIGLNIQRNATPTAAAPVVAAPSTGTGKIAFNSDRSGNWEIYLSNLDGSGLINLTNNPADDVQPAFTPDGTRIAFVSNRDGNSDIYVMNADGTGVINMTNNPAVDFDPAWSPDGGRLAFTSDRDGNFEVYISSQSGISRLTNNPASDTMPSWSATGALIAFASDRDGNPEIYVNGPNGLQRYTNTPAQDFWPRWSPAQDILAFESDRDGNWEIYVFATDGLKRYTDHPAQDSAPAWSPDGGSLAFISTREGNEDIFILGPNGLTQVTNDPAADLNPDWQP